MRFSASVTFLFRELPILERFAAARDAGFTGVEIQRLVEGNPAEMSRAASDAGLPVVLVNVPSGDWLQGGVGLSGVPGREEAFREAFEGALESAVVLGARYVQLGPSRIPDGSTAEECIRVLVSNARLALGMSRAAGVTLLVEPMNRAVVATELLGDFDRAAEVVRTVASPRLAMQFDVYHAALGGLDPAAAFAIHRPLVRHVQFADVPGRHEPGTGALDLPTILGAIERAGYQGWFGAEYVPLGETRERLGWMRDFAVGSAA